MKKSFIACTLIIALYFIVSAFEKPAQTGYMLEHENAIGKNETGRHNGGGNTTGYNFFASATNSKLVFRKRVLHAGSAIGYHLQKQEEIYYILSGTGEMTMNDKKFTVKSGDAILTFAGSSHGLKQTGTEDLAIIINYEKKGNQ